jgi:anaphase-promoting complex subunit 10
VHTHAPILLALTQHLLVHVSNKKDDGEATTIAAAKNSIRAVPTLDSLYDLRDLGRDAVCWTLSSAKPGNGVDQIRDSSVETYWQSDGSQPHCIQVVFARRVAVSHVCLYLDFNLDESYTPKKVRIETGMTLHELQTVLLVELSEPVGWCILPLEAPPDPLDYYDDDNNNNSNHDENAKSTNHRHIHTHLIQITVLTMHQNGRDTHVRQVKLFGPKREAILHASEAKTSINHGGGSDVRRQPNFTTVALSQFSTIR